MIQSVVEIGEQRRKREAMDSIISEIVKGSDENVPNTLRMAIERGWRVSVTEVLREARKRKELDISKIMSRHHPDFVVSVNNMLKLQPQTSELFRQVSDVHNEFQSTRSNLMSISDELSMAQKEREKMRSILDSMMKCQSVVDSMVQAREYVESHSHYEAVDTLETIQQQQLQLQEVNLSLAPFYQYLNSWLPLMTNQLLDTVRIDAQETIQTVRLQTVLIGQTLLQRCAYQLTMDAKLGFDSLQLESFTKYCSFTPSLSLLAIFQCSDMLRFDNWSEQGEFDSVIPGNFIDEPSAEGSHLIENDLPLKLASIYKAVYLHDKLNQGAAFDEFYRVSREVFLPQIFEEAEEMAGFQGLASIFPNLSAKLAGFFAIEFYLKHGITSSSGSHNNDIGNNGKTLLKAPSLHLINKPKKKKLNRKNKSHNKDRSDANIFSDTELSILWDRSVEYLHAFISRHMNTISNVEQLLQIKEELLILSELVSDDLFNLRPHGLYEIIRSMWSSFETLQVYSTNSSVAYALRHCTYSPFYVSSQQIYVKKILAYRLDTINIDSQSNQGVNNGKGSQSLDHALVNATLDALEADVGLQTTSNPSLSQNMSNLTLSNASSMNNLNSMTTNSMNGINFVSQTYPFSEVVPDILREIHLTITRFFLFAAKNPHLGSRGETLCASIKKVYESIALVLRQSLEKDGPDTPLSKACQISIDAATFAQSSNIIFQVLEPMLERFRWSESVDMHLPMAVDSMKNSLIQISIQAQDVVFELLSNKIDDLLESLVFINFIPTTSGPGSNASTTHESIDEIIDFLKITFMWLTHLPHSARDAAHFTSCSKVSNGILQFLTSSRVSAINLFCISIFDNDVKKLNTFAMNCGIPHLKQCFQELEDTIKILLNPDLGNLIDNISQRRSLYSKLDVNKLATILEKLVPTPINVTQINFPRVDKTAMKTYAKKLRAQTTTKR